MFSDIPPTMAPKNAPIPVVSPDRSVNITAFVLDIPPFFIGTDIDIPSGISCSAITKASEYPNFMEDSNPDPIASPSGKVCIANPIPTIIPVFSKELVAFFVVSFFLYNFFTQLSQNTIAITPANTPIKMLERFDTSNASGIKSKQIIALIKPAANWSIKLKNLFDGSLKVTPIIPPMVVPNVPKNNPSKVVLTISSTKNNLRIMKLKLFF